MDAKPVKYFLILAWIFIMYSSGFSQSSLLKKQVTVSFDNTSIEKILISLSNEAGFNFSYNSDIINVDTLVSFHGEKVTVESVLRTILPGDIQYKISGDYLILLKERAKNSRTDKNTKYEIKGYIYDSQTGNAIANVTVFDATGLESALSDSSGFYDLILTSKYEQINLHFSKQNFSDTLIVVEPADQSIDLKLRKLPAVPRNSSLNQIQPIKPVPVENLEFVKKIVSREQILQSQNIGKGFTRFGQVSVWPKVGTNREMSGYIENRFSFNLLAGYAQGVKVAEVGGLINIDRKNIHGFQLAGLGNIVGGSTRGIQIGGLFNNNRSKMRGLQMAGIENVLLDSIRGIQVSGISNVLRGSMDGVQISGINNYTSESVNGVQMAGISNITRKDVDVLQLAGLFNLGENVRGIQVSGMLNIAGKNVSGWQLAGLVNLARDTVRGLQVAGVLNNAETVKLSQISGIGNIASNEVMGAQLSGIFNYSKKVDGGQLSLINVADTVGGIPVGFLSLVKKGYHKIELHSEEVLYGNLTFKLGVRRFYNILTLGFRPARLSKQPVYGIGYGIGSQVGHKSVTLNFDLKGTWMIENLNFKNNNISYRLNSQLCFKITRGLGLFLGPSLNLHVSNWKDPETGNFLSNLAPENFLLFQAVPGKTTRYQFWAGASAGLRFL